LETKISLAVRRAR